MLQSKGYQIDFDDWHAHAHGVLPYELVKPDPALRKVGLLIQSAALQLGFCEFSLPLSIGLQRAAIAWSCSSPVASAQLNGGRRLSAGAASGAGAEVGVHKCGREARGAVPGPAGHPGLLPGARECSQTLSCEAFRHAERCLDLPCCRDSASRWPRTQLHLNSDPKAVKHTVRCLNKLEIRDWDFQVEVSQS